MNLPDILSLLFSFLLIAAVLFGCYKLSKYLTKRVNNASNSKNIKIVERVAFAQDKGLLIIEVCKKFYLIGFANNNIEILKELDEADLQLEKSALKHNFLDALNSALKGKTNSKQSDQGDESVPKPSFFEVFNSAFKSGPGLNTSDKGDKGDKIDEIDEDASHKEDD